MREVEVLMGRGMSLKGALMEIGYLQIKLNWPESMADKAIADLQPCPDKQDGPSTMNVLHGSGDGQG